MTGRLDFRVRSGAIGFLTPTPTHSLLLRPDRVSGVLGRAWLCLLAVINGAAAMHGRNDAQGGQTVLWGNINV